MHIFAKVSIIALNYVLFYKLFAVLPWCFWSCLLKLGTSVTFKCLNGFECWAVGNPQFWHDLRLGRDLEHWADFIETILNEADGAQTPSDPLNSPPCKWKGVAQDRCQDEEPELTTVLTLTFEQDRDNGPQFSSKQWPFITAGPSFLRHV